jgi:hypothetical protein
MVVEIDISKASVGKGFDLYMGDDCGGSGISVTGETADEALENLIPYLRDYLEKVSEESED